MEGKFESYVNFTIDFIILIDYTTIHHSVYDLYDMYNDDLLGWRYETLMSRIYWFYQVRLINVSAGIHTGT